MEIYGVRKEMHAPTALYAIANGPAGFVGIALDTGQSNTPLARLGSGLVWTVSAFGGITVHNNYIDYARFAASATKYCLVYRGYNTSNQQIVRVLLSTDGVNWTDPGTTPCTVAQLGQSSPMVHNGSFFGFLCDSGKKFAKSVDGITWTLHTVHASAYHGTEPRVYWCGGQFITNVGLNGQYGVFCSPDGVTWTKTPSTTADILPGTYLATDGTNLLAYNFFTAYKYGTDPTALAAIAAPPPATLYGYNIFYDGYRFVVANHDQAHAWDGLAWSPYESPGLHVGGRALVPTHIAYDANGALWSVRYLSTGAAPDIVKARQDARLTVYRPHGGSTANTTFTGVRWPFQGLASKNGVTVGFLAGNQQYGFVLSPTETTQLGTGTNQVYHLSVLPDGTFVAAATAQRCIRITDTTAEYPDNPASASQWYAHTVHNNMYLAIGANSADTVRTTDGGVTWTLGTIDRLAGWWSLVWHKGYYYALAAGDGESDCPVSRSVDGITWTPFAALPTSSNAYPVAVSNNTVLTVFMTNEGTAYRLNDAGDGWLLIPDALPTGYFTSFAQPAYSNGVGAVSAWQQGVIGYVILMSTDGLKWEVAPLPAGNWMALAPTDEGFVFFDSLSSELFFVGPEPQFWTSFANSEEV